MLNEQLNNYAQRSVTCEPNKDNNGENSFNSHGSNYKRKIHFPENGTFAKRAIKHMNNKDNCINSTFIRTLNEKAKKTSTIVPIDFALPGTYLNYDDDISREIIQFHRIYTKLECVKTVVNSAFSLHLIIILITKFTALTSLLYFCAMVIIKWVISYNSFLLISFYSISFCYTSLFYSIHLIWRW